MKLGINQAYFLPYLGFFQLIASVDKFIVYELLSFRKQSWMTKNRLLERNTGNPLNISIPVEGKSSYKLIRDIKLAQNSTYQIKKTLKKTNYNYHDAPYFGEVYPLLSDLLLQNPHQTLNDFNAHIIKGICNYLNIHTEIQSDNFHYTEMENLLEANTSTEEDTSPSYSTKVKRVLDICAKENATTFINLPGGQALYDPQVFAQNGIKLNFIAMPKDDYKQFNHDFVPFLSIVDVLMHCGQAKTQDFVQNYQFVAQ